MPYNGLILFERRIKMIVTVSLQGQTLAYNLTRKKVKNINLRIKPDQSIHVSAHPRVPIDAINSFVISKADYILSALNRISQLSKSTPAPNYNNGDIFYILGNPCTLKVIPSAKNFVTLSGSEILLNVKDVHNLDLKKRALEKWQTEEFEKIINDICKAVYPMFQNHGVPYPEIKCRSMVSMWGNCAYRNGRITFNKKLLRAPLACIEYVAVHEFTHFLHPNHSPSFYSFLSQVMPDWRQRKQQLSQFSSY